MAARLSDIRPGKPERAGEVRSRSARNTMTEPVANAADMADPSPGAVVAPQVGPPPEAPPQEGGSAGGDAGPNVAEAAPSPPEAAVSPRSEARPSAAGSPSAPAKRELPRYTRSLLKIAVPVAVTLAEKRQPLSQVVQLSPGTILQFDKSCEEMLDLSVAGHKIATGEPVKVGDKFGLKIHSVVLPDERFEAVRAKPKG